jgi:hypothetical protein
MLGAGVRVLSSSLRIALCAVWTGLVGALPRDAIAAGMA